MNTVEQWCQFNLAENNPDPGGGILYALRFAAEDLKLHQNRVIEALTDNGASIWEVDEQLGVDVSNLDFERRKAVILLLEELSVVNEALEYHKAGVDHDSISELSRHLKSAYYTDLTPDGKIDAYFLASVGISQIVHDLLTAHAQNAVLSTADLHEVEALQDFSARQTNMLGGRGTVIIG